jgi:hypothetical protein
VEDQPSSIVLISELLNLPQRNAILVLQDTSEDPEELTEPELYATSAYVNQHAQLVKQEKP